MNRALKDACLLVIDVQNDFCHGGSLEVKDGEAVVPVINGLSKRFFNVVATQDWHPADHLSFASNHPGKRVNDVVNLLGIEQVLWPDHCVAGSHGADFHPDLDTTGFSLIVRKGRRKEIDSYSAFFENDRKTPTGLHGYLKDTGVKELYLCGLATDYCVYYSAMDAVKLGYGVYLVEDAVRGVDFPQGNIERSISRMKEAGVILISSSRLNNNLP